MFFPQSGRGRVGKVIEADPNIATGRPCEVRSPYLLLFARKLVHPVRLECVAISPHHFGGRWINLQSGFFADSEPLIQWHVVIIHSRSLIVVPLLDAERLGG